MIKCNNGKFVVNGNRVDLLSDFTCIIKGLRDNIFDDELISNVVKIVINEDDEKIIAEKAMDELDKAGMRRMANEMSDSDFIDVLEEILNILKDGE